MGRPKYPETDVSRGHGLVVSGYVVEEWDIPAIIDGGWELRVVPESDTGDGFVCFRPKKRREDGIAELAYVAPRSQNYHVKWVEDVWPTHYPHLWRWWNDDYEHRPWRDGAGYGGDILLIKKDVLNMRNKTGDQYDFARTKKGGAE